MRDYFSPQVTLKYVLKLAQFMKLYHKSSNCDFQEMLLYKQ